MANIRKQKLGVGKCFIGLSILVALMAWAGYDTYQRFSAVSADGFRLQELRGQILQYDEILTMSAQMAAATGLGHGSAGARS